MTWPRSAASAATTRKPAARWLWWDANPKANPVSETLEGVYGLINPGNEDAKALEKVMLGAVPDCTGAMHHATTMAVLFIHANGWDEYARQMREAKARKVAG